jgi:hypothetical protein
MDFDKRTEQLDFSASLQFSQPPENWKTAMLVEPKATGFHACVKYHFKMCFDLSLHLALVEDTSPLFVTLNTLFNFALVELRLAEFKYIEYLLLLHLIAFDMKDKDMLFVLAQSLFRVRELLAKQFRQLDCVALAKRCQTNDSPFRHHSEKQLVRMTLTSLTTITQSLEKGCLVFKNNDKMDKDFWEHVVCRLGFVIHMFNRVLVLAPSIDRIDE